jgi:hypothetical protein
MPPPLEDMSRWYAEGLELLRILSEEFSTPLNKDLLFKYIEGYITVGSDGLNRGLDLGGTERQPQHAKPTTLERIGNVLKEKLLSPKQIYNELEERNWVPEVQHPMSYITHLLATESGFERVSRGLYKRHKTPATEVFPESDKRVLLESYLQREPNYTPTRFLVACGASIQTLRKILKSMETEGIVRCRIRSKRPEWAVSSEWAIANNWLPNRAHPGTLIASLP